MDLYFIENPPKNVLKMWTLTLPPRAELPTPPYIFKNYILCLRARTRFKSKIASVENKS